MKKLIASLALASVIVGMLISTQTGRGQEAAAEAERPHQIGLIDMAHVFKEYEKFKALSEGLRAEVEASDAEAQAIVQEMQQLQAQLTSGTLDETSPEYAAIERQLLEKQTELENFRKVKQREFLRKEAEIYKTVYLEVQDAVTRYATFYRYTLIMRFNRNKVEDASNPQEIIQSMNRPVVYYDDNDDITNDILNFLNQRYAAANGGGQPRSGGGE